MVKRFGIAGLALVSWTFALASCGSSSDATSGAVDTDASADRSLPDDRSTPEDASTGCPATIPAEGTPCSSPTLQCEYGAFEFSDCNSTATCGTKVWSVAPPPTNVCASNNTMCPATAADIHRGEACPSSITCFYPDATCACNAKGSADASVVWTCDDDPAPGCPVPRPHLGEPCTEEGEVCDYASCGKGVRNIGQRCKDGVWRFVFPTCDGG